MIADTDLELTGLDGSNPLAFLAALGVLMALDDAWRSGGGDSPRPRLGWRLRGVWRPFVRGTVTDTAELARRLDADRLQRLADPALGFTHEKSGGRVADVKATPEELRAALLTWLVGTRPEARLSLDWFTAFVSEGAFDGNGAAKPTALHFTAGQQKFLGAAGELATAVTEEHLLEAVAGPWTYGSTLPVMGWDNTETRDHALRASDPSLEKKRGNPGADWLAVRGLVFLPTAARAQRQRTAGCGGSWKSGHFTWPVWGPALTAEELRPAVTRAGLAELTSSARRRRGIQQVFRVAIQRSAQGGYGSVMPAQVM